MLSLVLTQIEDLKGAVALAFIFERSLNANHALAGGVDSKLAQVADDPLATELLGYGGHGARTAEEISNKIAFVGRSFDNTFKERFGLLGGIVNSLTCHGIDDKNICPQILNGLTFIFIEKYTSVWFPIVVPMKLVSFVERY